MANDKFNRDYQWLLDLQAKELRQWQTVLTNEAYQSMKDWCELTNGPAGSPRELHAVPVGCELHHFIMEFRSNESLL